MRTKAVRLYGEKDLRLEDFELPPIGPDEILAKSVSDSLCMSTYKAVQQGNKHKKVPDDVDKNPIIIGHEFCGEVVQVGKNCMKYASPGDKFTVQPAMFYKGSQDAPGYSYRYYGGDATYMIIPQEVFITNCFLQEDFGAYYFGSLAEPMSCIIGGFHTMYHTELGVYQHQMGIKENGRMAILGGAGPMGLGMIDYALHADRRPSLLVVTDIDEERIQRAKNIFSEEYAATIGVQLHFVNTKEKDLSYISELTDGKNFDDIFVLAPIKPVIEMGGKLMGQDCCMNFFAGPTDTELSAEINFYNIHYASTHFCGNSGGNTDDMREALDMMIKGRLNPTVMVTHIGGLNSVIDTTLNLPKIPGGKKLIYTQIDLPLTAIADFEEKGKTNDLFAKLSGLVKKTNGLWNQEAEMYLLAHGRPI